MEQILEKQVLVNFFVGIMNWTQDLSVQWQLCSLENHHHGQKNKLIYFLAARLIHISKTELEHLINIPMTQSSWTVKPLECSLMWPIVI